MFTLHGLQPDLPEYVSPEDVAKLLRVAKSSVYGWVRRGELPHYRIGRLLRFKRVDLDRFLAERRVSLQAGQDNRSSTRGSYPSTN